VAGRYFHIVEEQLREIRQDLPKSYYHELPKLAEVNSKTTRDLCRRPRPHRAYRLPARYDRLRRFIAGYQTVAPLSIGELWAVAITLRLALVENLRRLAVLIIRARAEREQRTSLR